MRLPLASVALVALVACADLPPPKPSAPDPYAEDDRRRERDRREIERRDEAERRRLLREAEDKAAVEARAREEERLVREEHAEKQAARQRLEAQQKQRERQAVDDDIKRARWLIQDTRWHTEVERGVLTIWFAYALLPRERRTTEAAGDAAIEALSVANGDNAARQMNALFQRRAAGDIMSSGKGAVSTDGLAYMPDTDWTTCLAIAPMLMQKHRKALADLGFVELLCMKTKTSTVTGNGFVEDQKRWKL